jgi:phage terminase small subunit
VQKRPENGRALTQKQAQFVDAYVRNGGKRTEAAIQAGYSPRYARMQAYELLKQSRIMNAITERAYLAGIGSAPHALETLRQLLNAKSDKIVLKASKAILDRCGIRANASTVRQSPGNVRVAIDLS